MWLFYFHVVFAVVWVCEKSWNPWTRHSTDGNFIEPKWKFWKDRCGNWYLGHLRLGLALCVGETDVNELLSCGLWKGILWSYLIYPPHPLLSWGSRQTMEARASFMTFWKWKCHLWWWPRCPWSVVRVSVWAWKTLISQQLCASPSRLLSGIFWLKIAFSLFHKPSSWW